MLKKFILILVLASPVHVFGMNVEFKEGNLTLSDLITHCKEIAESPSSQYVRPGIAGKIIKIKGVQYEVRYFSFQDTTGKMPSSLTFREYVKSNNLGEMRSMFSTPLPGIKFQSFDFRRSPLKDKVYFSMAVREIVE